MTSSAAVSAGDAARVRGWPCLRGACPRSRSAIAATLTIGRVLRYSRLVRPSGVATRRADNCEIVARLLTLSRDWASTAVAGSRHVPRSDRVSHNVQTPDARHTPEDDEALAVRGGRSVRSGRRWPAWPEFDEDTRRVLCSALDHGRWTVSWPTRGTPSLEREFAEAFAAYNGARYAVAVDHGSSALVIALEALDIGPGDEVVVPVQTWVATASAVLRVGATPVLADVDAATGCLTAESITRALSPATRAVVVVHLACTVSDLDAVIEVTEAASIPLVEDCAQAHGATWSGARVGTIGRLGAFSFQAGKVLASGEGGAVITSDAALYDRLQQLRADSRRYTTGVTRVGAMELVVAGAVIGANYTMSEVHAAILLDQLPRLDRQHRHREEQAQRVEEALSRLDGFSSVPVPAQVGQRSIYEYAIRIEPDALGNAPISAVCDALSIELERAVYPPDSPLSRSPLFRPWTKRRFAGIWASRGDHTVAASYPGAEAYSATTVLTHHSALLGDARDADDIVAACIKVRDNAHSLV